MVAMMVLIAQRSQQRVFGMQYSELKSEILCQGWRTAREQGTDFEREKNNRT
jgi:hypothetical protein